ncbi:DNA cytosine methyltransferase [Kineosporia sp. NBRC 101731]|uniref:DNA cytosine methyltransferase n=1 Tax=Kineosporia sp. NBRC 101731 TaxID=3032199 RepID=UPI0024A14638|nr:DNA cytosine methyltransferase [Kineosporia sp. NBRC 101731]GLY31594.1 hypothetical protein Kisp02_49590 [Kineosporia sp. NBRC 101731]
MVDLFAGPGGLDVAAAWLGIDSIGVEWDPSARNTRDEAILESSEIGDVEANDPLGVDFGERQILVGGPPCQTFTVAGAGAGRRVLHDVCTAIKAMGALESVEKVRKDLDERTRLVLQPLHWIMTRATTEGSTPYKAIVLEQVPAVLPVWAAMAEVLRDLSYNVDVGVLHTEEYGVPQTRRRAILIANLEHEVELPAPTHHRFRKGEARPTESEGLKPWVTMGEALGRKSEFTVISNYGTGGDPAARGKRDSGMPAFTVTGKVSRNRLIGKGIRRDVNDRFTISEMGRLQTFPHDYPWQPTNIAQQIGNAIPPRLAAHVLAAAVGHEIDLAKLDATMSMSWEESRKPKNRVVARSTPADPTKKRRPKPAKQSSLPI